MARKEFSKKTKRDAFMRAAGHCEGAGCGVKLTLGKFAYDHVNPDGLTGEPTLENCMVLCDPCHKAKTRQDVADIAKAKRREDAHRSIRRPATLQGQGFRRFAPQGSATRKIPKLEIAYRRDR
ncbi:HNH endonuclease [Methylobacterium sp. BTF04]|uniref:HNH endonuclease signature motif containing protein n=1 Tax=Methylobacterium sp. BTF04 TaxID=2708300 RepID=UPI0013D2F288|nr:HNH endonuclease signature motif containing protein [Methylobacterium sp. BTF04]NEU15066.1 HNH endonuclease [Methylobacterium sp. BTF04]